uniref:LRRCT domain-containing protein n=1 Tax=Cyprinus carpio TaxID=7962 RepID=A0A8C2IQ75_CYPCA
STTFKNFLSHNNLTHLPTGVFSPLKMLKKLDLSSNQFSIISADFFEDNNIDLPGEVFDALPKLRKLYLNKNPWKCDCNLLPFYEWMKNNMAKIRSKAPEVCEFPKNLDIKTPTSVFDFETCSAHVYSMNSKPFGTSFCGSQF